MNVSYNWLKDYIKTEQTPERLTEILTNTGLEVEGLEKIETIKGGLEGVVIGQVTSCKPHENSDHLHITTVHVGEEEELQIVCGASNVAEGQKVVVATVGSTLFPSHDESFKIKASKIRGVESFGMICAEDEIGIGQSHDGIMVLPENAKVGQKAAEYFDLESDYRIEIGLTPNRSDALGHIGVARDIVAFNKVHKVEKSALIIPDVSRYQVLGNGEKFKIAVETPEDCPRYMGCVISDITVKPSPAWLKNRLLAIGLNPINNIVDITNYVMYELGTPLHAFDQSKVGHQIVVRRAKEGSKFVTLDGVERTLSDEDLMITNGDEDLCIAGVFGGAESGITENTKSLFLEAAYFNPISIRKTAKRHGLSTDASFRYERGVDINMIKFAMKRAATLIVEMSGGTITYEPIPFYPKRIKEKEVIFSFARCNQLIGNEIDADMVREILSVLDFHVLQNNVETIKLQVPTYRVDVTREVDVIEEVLRIYGFNKITLPEKWNVSLSNQDLRSEEKRMNAIANLLVSKGFFEMMNNSISSSQFINDFGEDFLTNEHSVSLLNPLSQDLDVMRQSLIYQGLLSISRNINHQNPDVSLFEFGKIYQKFGENFEEKKRLTLFITGEINPEQWNTEKKATSFFTLKGIVQSILERLGLAPMVSTKALRKSVFKDGIQLYIQKNKIGEIGWTSTKLNKGMGVKQPVFIADLDWDMILSLGNRNQIKYTPLAKTFAMRRDFSLLLNKEVTFAEIEEIARKSATELLNEVNLFDVYEGKNLPENKKSYAVSFFFQDEKKTLKDSQIDDLMNKIREKLETELNAELR